MTADVERCRELNQPAIGLRVQSQAGQLLVGRRSVGLYRGEQQVDVVQHVVHLTAETLRVEQHALVVHATERSPTVNQAAQCRTVLRCTLRVSGGVCNGSLHAAVSLPVAAHRTGVRHTHALQRATAITDNRHDPVQCLLNHRVDTITQPGLVNADAQAAEGILDAGNLQAHAGQ
ncbi:hypothetical protein D3C71_1588190 [compost metagenome]